MFNVITAVDNGRINQLMQFETRAEADAFLAQVKSERPAAFITESPTEGGDVSDWLVVGNALTYSPMPVAAPLTEEEKIQQWLAANPYADALIRGMNKPATDPDHIPIGGALPDADLVTKIKANKRL